MYFEYGQNELDFLMKKDKRLGEIIKKLGKIERKTDADVFSSLVSQIISQQISTQAYLTVLSKVKENIDKITPENIICAGEESLKLCGVSRKKSECILHIAAKAQSGDIDFSRLCKLSDEEVIDVLTSFKGVGRWTAEMVLIFSLQRKNVLSYADFGVKRGLCMLYGHKEITKKLFLKYQRRFSPYGTIAAFYLWEISAGRAKELVNQGRVE